MWITLNMALLTGEGGLDCFAALAMTGIEKTPVP